MKSIVLLGRARAALLKHGNMAPRIREKLEAYALDSGSSANQVTELRGRRLKRMRVGDFRILFEETDHEIIVAILDPGAESTIDRTKLLNAKIITAPKGERLAIVPAEEYEDMRDALIHAEAMAEYRDGRDEGITLEEMQALLDAPTPLAFWRAKRGVSQGDLARAVGAAPEEIARVESGAAKGSLDLMTSLAHSLNIKVEELID